MIVNSTTAAATSTTGAGSAAVNASSETISKDAFLQLLITQMKNQDPLQPKDDGEFLTQLAQFSSLEQLTQINDSMQLLTTGLSTSGATTTGTTTSGTTSTSAVASAITAATTTAATTAATTATSGL